MLLFCLHDAMSGVYISWKALKKPLAKVVGMLGNLEAFFPFHFIFFKSGGGGVAGVTKRSKLLLTCQPYTFSVPPWPGLSCSSCPLEVPQKKSQSVFLD